MKKMNLALTLLALSAALSACTGSSSGGGSGANGGGDNKPASVDGPNIDGKWASECAKNWLGANRKMQLEVNGSDFYLKETIFEDAGCHQVREKTERRGKFSYRSKIFESNYIIQLHEDLENGASTDRYQNIKLVDDTLLVSEVNVNEDDVVSSPATIPLKKISSAPQPGQPGDSNIEIEQGDYAVSDGFNYRNVNLAVGKTDGKLSMVVVSFIGTDIAMGMLCEKNICKDPQWANYELEILDTRSFRFSKVDTSDLAIFRKR